MTNGLPHPGGTIGLIVSTFISLLGAILVGYSVIARVDLPLPMYPLLGLMMGVLPASLGNQYLKKWGGG